MNRVRIPLGLTSVMVAAGLAAAVTSTAWTLSAAPEDGRSSIVAGDLKEWLTFVASDDLQGRAVFSAGLGLAAGYIGDHLRAWGVTPAGTSASGRA